MKRERQFDRRGDNLEEDARNIPEKGGFIGRFLIALIIICVLAMIVLAFLLLKR